MVASHSSDNGQPSVRPPPVPIAQPHANDDSLAPLLTTAPDQTRTTTCPLLRFRTTGYANTDTVTTAHLHIAEDRLRECLDDAVLLFGVKSVVLVHSISCAAAF